MNEPDHVPTIDREVSWLSFNERVLQEAADPTVPVFERLAFLAIYSSNLDEFFRVRVAALRSLLRLKQRAARKLDFDPAALLRQLTQIVTSQQEHFGEIFRGRIVPELADHGIHIVDEARLDERQAAFVRSFFASRVRSLLRPVMLTQGEAPFVANRQLHLAVELWPASAPEAQATYAVVRVPADELGRFVEIPGGPGQHVVMFLDDLIRHNLASVFPDHEVAGAYAVKLSRDAELYLDDAYSGDHLELIKQSLRRRETGLPCRFLYDPRMPYAMQAHLQRCLGLEEEDLVPGGRYHNFHDFFGFPRFGREALAYPAMPPLPHPGLDQAASIWAAVAERDRMLHFPYQSFEYVTRFFEAAAQDDAVEAVWATLYRVAPDSALARALIEAARRGKQVTVFVEVKARFDEATNVAWAERMRVAGVRVLYGLPGLKVHAKLALVVRREGTTLRRYAYLGTGNFNEKTARVYADHGLLTADERLTVDVEGVFQHLAGERGNPVFEHLLVAPRFLRQQLYALIDAEAARARRGEPAEILLKVNNLEDKAIIARLYAASQAGVRIHMVVRSICRLLPGVAGLSEQIHGRSIVDRFLEHARVFVFHNGGQEKVYLASADWMTRNLSHRVEVAFPVYDPDVRREVRTMLALQLADDTKARILDPEQRNRYAHCHDRRSLRAQMATYDLLRGQQPASLAGQFLAEGDR
jgi:polyphosphate kinase